MTTDNKALLALAFDWITRPVGVFARSLTPLQAVMDARQQCADELRAVLANQQPSEACPACDLGLATCGYHARATTPPKAEADALDARRFRWRRRHLRIPAAGRQDMRHGLVTGVNVDAIDVAAGLRELTACGYTDHRTVMVIQHALMRWQRGEEKQAERGAIDKSFYGIDLTSWRRTLAGAMAGAAPQQEQQNDLDQLRKSIALDVMRSAAPQQGDKA